MYRDLESLQQSIGMCNQLFAKSQFTTVVLLLQPALPSQNLKLLQLLAKSYLCLGFYKSCRQVSLIACNVIKASAVRDERTPDLIGFLNLIILSEIELNMAVAKEHEDEIKALLKDSKDLQAILAEFDKARDKKKKQPKIDPGEVKAHFDKLIEKARADEYLKESGVPAYVVSASWIRSFEEGAIEPINSLELIQRSQYLDLDKSFLHLNYLLKPTKQQGSDYILLAKEPWDYILSVFKGTQLRRMTTKIGDNVIVEVKYRTVRVLFVTSARIKALDIPLARTEVVKNIKNHLKRILIWHSILDKDSGVKQNKLFIIKDMHDTSLLTKQIAAKKLNKNLKVIQLNDMAELQQVELAPREFLVFQFLDKPGVSLFGNNIPKQAIEGMDRCLTCCKKEFVTLCDCKAVSFCSVKCKTSNIKHVDACKKTIKDKNPLESLLMSYNVSKDVKLPSSFKAGGKTGLENIGNTCFMNSALQCLANIEDLTMYFLKNQHLPEINIKNPLGSEGKLACSYGQFLKQLFFSNRKAIEPRTLKRIIQKRNSQFSGYNQQDSQQFLSYFLDLLHEDLNRVKDKPAVDNVESDGRPDDVISQLSLENYHKRNKSIVTDLMVGQYKSELHCPDCKRVSITFDPYMTVTLPLPSQKEARVDMEAYPILLDGTIGKVSLKIPTNRLMSYFYELLGRKFCGAFISDRKIKKSIESQESVKTISESNSSLFLYEVEENANLEVQLTVLSEAGKDLTFARRLKRKEIGSAERLKEVILLSLKSPLGAALGLKSPTDEQYLQACEQKDFVNFKQIANFSYPLLPNSVTKLSIVLREPIATTAKLNSLGNYPVLPPQKLTIPYLLKNFAVPQQLTQDNAWYCSVCKAHKLAKKKLCLYTTPRYLVMHLKRFSHKIHGRYVSNSKIDSTIKLSEYEIINGKKYELVGMVNHMGSLSGGHYTATLKKNEWLCFDDDRIRYDKMSGEYAYLLFYRQVE